MTDTGSSIEFKLVSLREFQMEIQILQDGAPHDLTVGSVFSEPLRDLLDAMADARTLLDGGKPTNLPHFEFEWLGEGLLYDWKISLTDEKLMRFQISFSGSPVLGGKQYQVWELDFIIPWETFATQLVAQCGGLLQRYGFQCFRRNWGRDFPVAQVLALADAIKAGAEECDIVHELELLRSLT